MARENISDIGSRIKERRKLKGLTIKNMVEYTGLSLGYLSNLERNQNSPTLENLRRICEVLEISITDILAEPSDGKIVVRREDTKVTEYAQYRQLMEYIDFGISPQIYEYITIQPGTVEESPGFRHLFDEICTVVKGEMVVRLDDQIYILHERDSIYIKAQHKHSISNESDQPCVSFWVCQRKELADI